MDKATLRAINDVSNRVNEVSAKLDMLMQLFDKENKENIETNAGGIDELAEMSATNAEAIDELATLISELEG